MVNTRMPSLQRARAGWVARGPRFYVWQEDEASARMWLEALTGDESGRDREPAAPEGEAREDEPPPRH